MKLKRLSPEHQAELARIQNSIPRELSEKVVCIPFEVQKLIGGFKRGMDDPTNSDELRNKCKLLYESEMFQIESENLKIQKKIDDFIQSEIEKSVKRGTLPKGKKFRNLKKKIKNERL